MAASLGWLYLGYRLGRLVGTNYTLSSPRRIWFGKVKGTQNMNYCHGSGMHSHIQPNTHAAWLQMDTPPTQTQPTTSSNKKTMHETGMAGLVGKFEHKFVPNAAVTGLVGSPEEYRHRAQPLLQSRCREWTKGDQGGGGRGERDDDESCSSARYLLTISRLIQVMVVTK